MELKLANLAQAKKKKKKIPQDSFPDLDLELATTSQIFQELSKRGRVILLLPHRNREGVYVETLAARLSPSQTMGVLKVAYSGIAGNLEEGGVED